MRRKKSYLVFSILIICIGCSTVNKFKQGEVNPIKFRSSTPFTTIKSIILIPCELDGQTKNFIFDTGSEVTGIQRDTIFGEIVTVRGGSNRTVENGSETVKSLKIGGVDFVNTFATNGNDVDLLSQIPNYGGILGRTVIDKANWLINYPSKTIGLSNADLSDDSYTDIPLDKSASTPYTHVEIDNKKYKAIIDLGSSSTLNVPEGTELANLLIRKYVFKENTRERYTIGGTQTITELVGHVPLLKIDDLEFELVDVNINHSSQIRLGIGFFKDYLIYIDNTNHRYRIKLAE